MSIEYNLVKAIEENIDGWIIYEDRILIKPKNSLINFINICSIDKMIGEFYLEGFINLLNYTDIWINLLKHSIKDNIFDLTEIFLDLIGYEVLLKWKGLIYKNPIFINNPKLYQFKKINIKNELMTILNNNINLLNKIKIIKPKYINIEIITNSYSKKEDTFQNIFKTIENPSDIIWKINAHAYLTPNIKTSKIVDSIDIMNIIAKDIIKVTRFHINNL